MNRSLSEILDDYIDHRLILRENIDTIIPNIERQCEICRDVFPIDIHSTARICPECLRRLERMLYPERED